MPTRAQSPAYRKAYYDAVAELLRKREVRLDRDLLPSELQEQLVTGTGVTLPGRREQLYHMRMRPGSPAAEHEVRSLGLAQMGVVIVGLTRGEGDITPQGGTKLQVGDGLLIAARGDGIAKFRALIQLPAPTAPSDTT